MGRFYSSDFFFLPGTKSPCKKKFTGAGKWTLAFDKPTTNETFDVLKLIVPLRKWEAQICEAAF